MSVPLLSNLIHNLFGRINTGRKKYLQLDYRSSPRLIARYSNKPNITSTHSFYSHKFTDSYHYLIDLTWWKLFLILTLMYFSIHVIFGFGYWISGGVEGMAQDRFIECVWFSIHTMSTIGFGNFYPKNTSSNILVCISSWTSYFVDAFIISLVLGKFSRPSRMSRNIVFSKRAVLYKKYGKFGVGKRTINLITEPLDTRAQKSYGSTSNNPEYLYNSTHIINEQIEGTLSNEQVEGKYPYEQAEENYFNGGSINNDKLNIGVDYPRSFQNDFIERPHSKNLYNRQKDGNAEGTSQEANHSNDDCYISFRCCNVRVKSTLIHSQLKLFCIIHDPMSPSAISVHELDFELNGQMKRSTRISFSTPVLPLPWTITHHIDIRSPLYPFITKYRDISSIPSMDAPSFELIPILDATDGGTSQEFQSRFSYRPDEIYVDCILEPCLSFDFQTQSYTLDHSKFHSVKEI